MQIMQMMGLEPTRALAHMTLNHACLPIPTHLRESKNYSPINKKHAYVIIETTINDSEK